VTFEIELAALGRAAAGLLLESDRMPPTSVRTAEAAQVAQYRLLHEVHRVLIGNVRKAVSVESIGQHPVAVLGRILRYTARARRTDLSTSDGLASKPSARADALWMSVLRHATVALAEWQMRTGTPADDGAWSLLGDIAALSEAAAVLDEDLAAALAASGRPADATALRQGSARHLRLAGARSAALASMGSLPALTLPPPAARAPVLVRSAASVAEGQRRLAAFLLDAEDVTPQAVFVVAAMTGQSARAAAEHTASPEVAAALEQHAGGLAAVVRQPGRCATIRAGDSRPEAQAYELRRHLRSLSSGTEAAEASDAFASGLPPVAEALSRCAGRQNWQCRWLVPAAEPGIPLWQRSGTDSDRTPPFVGQLVQLSMAVSGDDRLPRPGVPPAVALALSAIPPRSTLAGPLRSANLPETRPRSPAERPVPGRAR